MTDLSKSQPATILSALDSERRSPANKDAALKAIVRSAQRLGLTTEAVLAAAAGLLGRLDAEAWRAQLTERPVPPAGERIATSLRVAFPDLPDGLAIEAEGPRRSWSTASANGWSTSPTATTPRPTPAGAR
jgi:hypothetical protein